MTERLTEPVAPLSRVPMDEFEGLAFELGLDGTWRAFDQCGLVAVAPSFRQLFERMGGRWH